MQRFTAGLVAVLVSAACSAPEVRDDPATQSQGESIAPGTLAAQELFANERYWPYRVKLVRSWSPGGGAGSLPARSPGVLIRLENASTARVDFSRLGIHSVPIEVTNIVEEAQRVADGQIHKFGPNLVMMVAPRLYASHNEILKKVIYPEFARHKAFLFVFADPEDASFDEIRAALHPLQQRRELAVVLLPQGQHADGEVLALLRAAKWPVPFMRDQLSEMYRETLLGDRSEVPAVTLQTAEGRLLLQRRWTPEALEALDEAIEAQLGVGAGINEA